MSTMNIVCIPGAYFRSTIKAYRSLSTASSLYQKRHQKILILGGGCGGVTMASRLAKIVDPQDITVVDQSDVHFYQPLWTLVGAGVHPLKDSKQPMREVIPRSVEFIQDTVNTLNPKSNSVTLQSGDQISYDYLILALGISLRFDLVTGSEYAMNHDPRVSSNYSVDHAEKTFKIFQTFNGGKAVFTLPAGPIKCAGAPQKVMYMFDDYLRKHGHRDKADLHYFTSLPKMFAVQKYSDSLAQICRERGITSNYNYNLIQVDHEKSTAIFEHLRTKEHRSINYDFLHITPPMSVPKLIQSTPNLGNPDMFSFVDVDIGTLRHKTFPNIFSLGDCAALPISKTAAAISSQSKTLTDNLLDVMHGGSGKISKYEGYTSCPLITGYDKGILAEFDYTNEPLETLPIDQGKERYLFYFIKAKILPPLYWDWLLRGMWSGPARLRKLLHLGYGK